MKKFKPKFRYTKRGFSVYEFKDQYGKDCSLQHSSIVEKEQYIWLGREKNEPDHLGHELSPRMHLSQSQAKWLGEKLIKFAETGSLEENAVDS